MTQVDTSIVNPTRFEPSSVLLQPGPHLFEIETARPTTQEVITRVLERFRVSDLMFDEPNDWGKSRDPSWREWGDWGTLMSLPDLSAHSTKHRIIARVRHAVVTANTIDIRWLLRHPMTIDPKENADHDHTTHFPLIKDHTYALRFLSRLIKYSTRASVIDQLALMGFEPHKVCWIEKNTRVEGKPKTSVSRWYAVATWRKPDSVTIGMEDPFFFEHVRGIG